MTAIPESNTKPIGLLGGAFDPVHSGHVHLARACVDGLDLQEVRFIPAYNPPHKAATGAGPQHRLAMLQLALEPYPSLTVSDVELRRGGTSYTIDTLIRLRADAPGQAFCFILGADAFAALPGWRRWQELTEYAHLVIIDRNLPARTHCSKALQRHYAARACAGAARLHERRAGCVYKAAITVPDISSSQVRALLKKGENAAHVLPPGVYDYIKEHRLYQ